MKNLISILLIALAISTIKAQTPQAFKYQAVVRNNAGEILQNQEVGVRISIHDATAGGAIVYQETFTDTTNQFGLVNLEIGTGSPTIGTFTGIDWSANSKFIETEIDPAGGTTYVSMGTSELLAVPYALFSDRSKDAPWEKSGDDIYFNDGNVGIGTSTPSSILHVAGDMRIDENSPYLNFYSGVTQLGFLGIWTNNDMNLINKTSSGSLKFGTKQMERMRIDSSGNIGIGVTSPASMLHVKKSSGEIARLESESSNSWLSIYNSTGYIGYFGAYSGSQDIDIGTGSLSTGKLHLVTEASPKLTITADGNVGIGYTNPSYKLEVNGVIYASESRIYNSIGDGIFISNPSDDGIHIAGANGDGVYSYYSDGNGVDIYYSNDDGVYSDAYGYHLYWGFYTEDQTYSQGGYYPAKSGTFAKNKSSGTLESGDLVCISGGYEKNVLGEECVPVVNITKANSNNSQSIFGVVESRVYIREKAEELEDSEILVKKSFRFSDEIIKPGDYLSVIVFGIAEVNVDGKENIKSGQKLTVSESDGTARTIISSDNWADTGILGKALEDSNGKNKIKVFVNCK